jgi:hypothetical protein
MSSANTKSKDKNKLSNTDILQTEIDISMGLSNSLVSSWLGDEKDTKQNSTSDSVNNEKIEVRPSRLGLGAKFLPHKHYANLSQDKVENKLKRQIINQNKKQNEANFDNKPTKVENDDDDEDSRTSIKRKTNAKKSTLDDYLSKKKKRK